MLHVKTPTLTSFQKGLRSDLGYMQVTTGPYSNNDDNGKETERTPLVAWPLCSALVGPEQSSPLAQAEAGELCSGAQILFL